MESCMAIYSPSQIFQDAHRHGIENRPKDFRFSAWSWTLESDDGSQAIRLGLREARMFAKAVVDRVGVTCGASTLSSAAVWNPIPTSRKLDVNERFSEEQIIGVLLMREPA